MSADLVRKLSALGLNLEQVVGVMEIFDADTEERRSKVRQRVQKWRDGKRAGNVTETSRNVTERLTRVEDSSSKKDISGKEESKNLSHEFETEFWPAYPRKAGKPAALKAFLSARKRAPLGAIMVGVLRYAAERAGEDAKFTKHPQGWLSGDHWNDEPAPPRTATGPPGKPPPAETVGSLSRKQLFTPRNEIDVTDYSAGRVDAGGRGRLEEGTGASRTFAITGDVFGRI